MNDNNNITNCPKCGRPLRKTLHNGKYIIVCDACKIAFDITENLDISLEKCDICNKYFYKRNSHDVCCIQEKTLLKEGV